MDNLVENDVAWIASGFAALEQRAQAGVDTDIHRLRRKAFEKFQQLGFPTTKNEEWKYTSTNQISRGVFTPQLLPTSSQVEAGALADRACLKEYCGRLVFINGFLAPDLSEMNAIPAGMRVRSIREVATENSPDRAILEQYLAKVSSFEEQAFVALNTAFLQDGALIVLEHHKKFDLPLLLQFVATGESASLACCPRVLVIAEPNSEGCVVEQYLSLTDKLYLTTAVTELVVAENAKLEHCKVQEEAESAMHISSIDIHQARSSRASTYAFSFGGRLARNEVNPTLLGEGCENRMLGLSVLDNEQHVDNHTVLDHAKPHCESNELYKGIYAGRAKGVFNGTIIVRQHAQKTNAIQSNQSLLLSDTAESNSKPQLKIWADDVKCTHGATVGQLDRDAMFYLRSRGISEIQAKDMLIKAFAGDILNQIPLQDLREFVEKMLFDKLEKIRLTAAVN